MKNINHRFNEGDKVVLDDFIDGFNRGDVGIIEIVAENYIIVDFEEKGTLRTQWYNIKPWVNVKKLNPRQLIRHQYAQWVDEVCYVSESKTTVSMEEVQETYSKLAIEMVIRELREIADISGYVQRTAILDRIKYLEGLI